MSDARSPNPRHLRVFIASPDDVGAERETVERLVGHLNHEYGHALTVEATRWEHEPLVATADYQSQLSSPRNADVVVVVVWTKLGSLLAVDRFPGPLSGGPVTGTEYEFEVAWQAAKEQQGRPELLFYRRTSAVPVAPGNFGAQMKDLERVETFMTRWFGGGRDRPATAAHFSYAEPADFEGLCREHLRRIVLRRLERLWESGADQPDARPWLAGSPFPGLRSFKPCEAPVFFGRGRARVDLRQRLARQIGRGTAFMLVLGASGSGKSSLVKAGLLADLKAGQMPPVTLCRHAILRPGDRDQPLAALAAALLEPEALPGLAWDEAALLQALRDAPGTVSAPLAQALAAYADPGSVRLVLVVDQLEELFTNPNLTVADQDRFVAALETLAGSGRVWVVATLRSDFFERIDTLPRLARLSGGEASFRLLPPGGEELDRIIRGPAAAAGLGFDSDPVTGESLADTLRTAALAASDGLPLLSYLLEQLWDRRNRDTGHLTVEAYHELGGLEGALGQRAEAVFKAQPPEVQAALPRLLRELTAVGQHHAARPSARWAPMTRFPSGSPLYQLAHAFLAPEVRLITVDGETGAPARLRVAHEALLSHWKRAAGHLTTDRVDLQLRTRLEQSARDWSEAEPAARPDHLLSPALLIQAEDLRARRGEDLGDSGILGLIEASAVARAKAEELRRDQEQAAERERLKAETEKALLKADAARRERRRTRIAAAVLAVLLVIASIGAWFGWSGRKTAEDRLAEKALGFAQVEKNDAEANSRAAEDARQRATTQEQEATKRPAEAQLNQSRYLNEKAQAAERDGDHERAALIALAGLPRQLPAADRPLERPLLNTLTEAVGHDRLKAILAGHEDGVWVAAFSPDGTRIVTASEDGTARVWDAASGKPGAVLSGHTGWVESAAFSPDGTRIVTASEDKTARVWNAASGKPGVVLSGHTDEVESASFSPDGTRIVTASSDHTARVWDAASGKPGVVLSGHTGAVESAAFSLDGTRIVTASADHTARVWDAASGKPGAVLNGHFDWITSAAFSPDGTRVVTVSFDHVAWVWDAASGKPGAVLSGHAGRVESAAFSPDGTRIVTTSRDHTARVWDAASGKPGAVLSGHTGEVESAAFSPDGTRVVTVSFDNIARVWDAASGKPGAVLSGHGGWVVSAAFSPDGTRIVTASWDKTARVWDAASGKPGAVLSGHGSWVVSAAFSPDGTRIVTASDDGTARVWDAASGKPDAVLSGHTNWVMSAAFSPDGTRIVTVSEDKTARVWDAASGKLGAVLSGHAGEVESAAFSRDGTRIVTASADKTAGVWDAALGVIIAILEDVSSPAFDLTGDNVVTISEGHTAQVWPIPRSAAELLAAARMRAPRALTADEKKANFLGEDEGEDDDPVFGALVPKGDAGEQRRLAEQAEDKGELAEALYHHALAARLYALNHDQQAAAFETARRATVARSVSLHEAAAVWRRLNADLGG